MKIFKYLFLLSIGFASCQKEESFELPEEKGGFSMKIDGTLWNAENAQADYRQSILSIIGTTNDGKSIVFMIKDPKVGTFYSNPELSIDPSVAFNDPTAYSDASFLITHEEGDAAVPVLEITEIDFEKGFFSATFAFDLQLVTINGGNGNAGVSITEGKITKLYFGSDNTIPDVEEGATGASNWSFDGVNRSGDAEFEVVTYQAYKAISITMVDDQRAQQVTIGIALNNAQQPQSSSVIAVSGPDNQVYTGFTGISDFSFDENAKKLKFKFSADITDAGNAITKRITGEVNIGY
jgi:hypothetical protein